MRLLRSNSFWLIWRLPNTLGHIQLRCWLSFLKATTLLNPISSDILKYKKFQYPICSLTNKRWIGYHLSQMGYASTLWLETLATLARGGGGLLQSKKHLHLNPLTVLATLNSSKARVLTVLLLVVHWPFPDLTSYLLSYCGRFTNLPVILLHDDLRTMAWTYVLERPNWQKHHSLHGDGQYRMSQVSNINKCAPEILNYVY